MCGPSKEEKALEAQQASFASTLQKDYATTFGNQQQILSTLNGVLQPIAEAGPGQQGFSEQENTALNTQAIDSNAEGYNQALKAVGAQENAAGGGRSFLPSGVNAQINSQLASSAESNLSNEKLGITEQNYATGRQNWMSALSGEESIAAGQAPLGYASAGTQGNSAAFGEANTINQETNQMWSDILGGITGGIANIFHPKSTNTGGQ